MMRPQKQEKRNFKFNLLAHIKGGAKVSIKTSFVQLILPNNQGKNNNVSLGLKVIPQYCIAHPYCARFLRH